MISKKIAGCLLLYLLSCSMMNAQALSTVEEATKEMRKYISLPDTVNGNLLNETNNLQWFSSLYSITTDSVVVGMLVNNKAGNGIQGDYSAYWKGKQSTSDRYTWVFVWDDFKKRCVDKNVNQAPNKSKRACQLLGLSDKAQRDTIVLIKVKSDRLFRPAYNRNTNDTLRMNASNHNITDVEERLWFIKEQRTNEYPWTRKGYTYDWGNAVDYFGVSEFILKPNSPFRDLKAIILEDSI